MPVEERRSVYAERVVVRLLAKEADDYQVVAQDADAALCCLAARRKRLHRVEPLTNRRKEIEFNAGLHGGGTVERLKGVDHPLGRRQPAPVVCHQRLLLAVRVGVERSAQSYLRPEVQSSARGSGAAGERFLTRHDASKTIESCQTESSGSRKSSRRSRTPIGFASTLRF